MSVRGDTSWVIYTLVFPIFNNSKKLFSSLHHCHFFFVRLLCKLSSSKSSDPYHFGGTRSVLSWETIVHYPQYKLRGQIRLKDTTLSLGSDMLSNYCLYCRFVSFIFFWFLFFERTRELHCRIFFGIDVASVISFVLRINFAKVHTDSEVVILMT